METDTPKPATTFAKVCDECKKGFDARKSNARYCSSTCRSKASMRRSILNGPESTGSPLVKRPDIALPTTGDPASQFIIGFLKDEVSRFETLYNEERTQRKDAKKTISDLKDQILKMETDSKIAAATVPQKSTLDGIMDHPMASQLLSHIGPALGELSMQMVKKATAGKVNAPQAALAGADAPVWDQFTSWLGQQPEDVQRYVAELMMAFTQVQGVEVLQKLYQVRELIMGQYMRATG